MRVSFWRIPRFVRSAFPSGITTLRASCSLFHYSPRIFDSLGLMLTAVLRRFLLYLPLPDRLLTHWHLSSIRAIGMLHHSQSSQFLVYFVWLARQSAHQLTNRRLTSFFWAPQLRPDIFLPKDPSGLPIRRLARKETVPIWTVNEWSRMSLFLPLRLTANETSAHLALSLEFLFPRRLVEYLPSQQLDRLADVQGRPKDGTKS